jgi:hypothetical protein
MAWQHFRMAAVLAHFEVWRYRPACLSHLLPVKLLPPYAVPICGLSLDIL